MTNDNPPPTPGLTLSDKLMAMNHLTTFVPQKLDVDVMNNSSWVYYFSHLCHGYGILDHLVDLVASSSTMTPTDPPPKDAKWTKIDFIIRYWIFSTLAPSLRKCLVDLNPNHLQRKHGHILRLFSRTNKCPRVGLKVELHNLKLWDLSIDGYFQKIESIVSVLNGLGSPLSNDNVVTFALEGLPSTYEMISTVIVSRESFPDLKMVISLLTTHEMRLKSRVQNPLVVATSAFSCFYWGAQSRNGYVIPTGGSVSNGVTTAGGPFSTVGGSDAFWSTSGGSPCTWNFIATSSVYDRG
ncbi:hypothetical protein Tco_0483884 [Tanacetum coccineum]